MIISRGAGLLRNVVTLTRHNKTPMKAQVRHSGGVLTYRDIGSPTKLEIYLTEALGGLMWWWIFWHFWHDWGHIVGEFPYPEASEWTDEELGIPPDDLD